MRFALAGLALFATTASAHAQAVTTRIETRPYYGAVTTIEHGVRVMRALPAHDRIIINPNGAAPVSINVGNAEPGQTVIQQHSNQTNVYRPNVPYYGVPHPGVRGPHSSQGTKSGRPRP